MPSTAASGVSPQEKFLGSITKASDWMKTRLNGIDIFDEHYNAEAKTNPWYAIGSVFYLVWFLVMATGLLLIMWYIPTKAGAFDSILRIQHEIPFGNIVRGVHKYGADAMIIAATIRMYRMFICADYKPGKEFNIAIGLVTLLLSMYSGLTGYLLIWNQRAFWATKVFATFPTYMDQFPVMGDFYLPIYKSLHLGWNTAEFLLGAGGAITQETITRFFSLHLAFSLIPLMFVELYFYKTGYKRVPLNWIKRCVVIAMLVIVAIIMPAALGHRSNPDVTPLPILSDWYFLGLYQMYKYLEPVVATEITMVIPLSVVLLPFLDVWITGPEKDINKRPFILWVSLMGFISWIVFSGLIIVNIANIHSDPPYWRDFTYLFIDIGIVLQCLIFLKLKTPLEKTKAAFGAAVMGWVALVQFAVGVVYYYMAKTEMFLSPLTQAWAYMLARPFLPADAAARSEQLVRALQLQPVEYWNYRFLLADAQVKGTVGSLPFVKELQEFQQIASQSSLIDPLFQLIPTFQLIPEGNKMIGTQYLSTLDFMLSNRWTFDYITFMDRMNGVSKDFPAAVPTLDWVWMIAGLVTAVICFIISAKLKSSANSQNAASSAPKPVTTAS